MRGPLARWIFETLGKGMGPIWVATSCRKKEKIQTMENIHEIHMKIVLKFEKIENT